MFTEQQKAFLKTYLPHDWRAQVVKRMKGKVHPTAVSHVYSERRWNDRIALHIVAVAKANKEKMARKAKRIHQLL